jgi:CheY-like chemotaxis protein
MLGFYPFALDCCFVNIAHEKTKDGFNFMTDKMPIIVVVDDSVTSISLYQFGVEPLHVDFVGFKSSAEALPYLQENQPDLLFLDIIMPGMDGLSLLKYLRTLTLHQNTPVIMVTSKDYAQDRQVAKQLGALDFLIKPLRLKEIRNIVCKYVEVKSK